MSAIKAVVRNGRIETDEPLDLPEGTELWIPVPDTIHGDDDWDTSPEAIAARLAALETLEPLLFTPEERAAWEAEQQARKEWEKTHFNEYTDMLRKLWK